MNIAVNLDAVVLQAFLARYPQATEASINLFKDRVGYTLENQAKKDAPAITGNLRRQIFFSRNSNGGDAVLYSYAEYSKFVHGAPYHQNRKKRRETPFFTNALRSKRTFIKDEAADILKRVLQ